MNTKKIDYQQRNYLGLHLQQLNYELLGKFIYKIGIRVSIILDCYLNYIHIVHIIGIEIKIGSLSSFQNLRRYKIIPL